MPHSSRCALSIVQHTQNPWPSLALDSDTACPGKVVYTAAAVLIEHSGHITWLLTHCRAIAGTTESNYMTWAKQNDQPVRSITLPSINNTKAFWVGEPDAENVVIFCGEHGEYSEMKPSWSICFSEFNTFHDPLCRISNIYASLARLYKVDMYMTIRVCN